MIFLTIPVTLTNTNSGLTNVRSSKLRDLNPGDRVVQGSNPAAATYTLRNFGNSVYPALPGVYARGSKRSHQFALGMCNLSWTPPPTLRDHTSSWSTLEMCYPVIMMCSKLFKIDVFNADTRSTCLILSTASPATNVNELVASYNLTVKCVLDKHAPERLTTMRRD